MKLYLSETEKAQLTLFFREAFHRTPEQDKNYFEEWEYRMQSGQIMKYMDSEILKIWIKIQGGSEAVTKCFPCFLSLGCSGTCPYYNIALQEQEARRKD